MSYAYNKGKKNRRNVSGNRKPKKGHQIQHGQHSFRNFKKLISRHKPDLVESRAEEDFLITGKRPGEA